MSAFFLLFALFSETSDGESDLTSYSIIHSKQTISSINWTRRCCRMRFYAAAKEIPACTTAAAPAALSRPRCPPNLAAAADLALST